MKTFVFSADSHIMEPKDLFTAGLPASLKRHAIRAEMIGDYLTTRTDEKVIHRLRIGSHREQELGNFQRRGIHDIEGRLDDMELEGIDSEICFPSLGIWIYAIEDPDAEAASVRLYNDWNARFLGDHPQRFVKCGVLPVADLGNAVAELNYLAGNCFKAAMLPSVTRDGIPKYNDEAWDPVFCRAGELGIALVMHTGTGLATVVHERGPGGAIINYTRQMNDAMTSAMYLVSGGVLDRNPKARVAFIESGASWLVALAERMDEVCVDHSNFVRPKLSRAPSEIVDNQLFASFQHDRACILAADKGLPGARNIMWGSDYPHAEGTFPISRQLTRQLFEGLDVSDETRDAVLGLNAARLFGIDAVVSTKAEAAE